MKTTFGPAHCRPHLPDPCEYRAEVPPDDGGPITFNWHWPRGTFDERMSALEIAAFLLPHMPAILSMRLLKSQPRVEQEFQAMLVRLATWPKEALDELCTWVKPVVRTSEDDLIQMEIGCKVPQPDGPTYFV